MTRYQSLRNFLEQNHPTINREFDDGSILTPNTFLLYGIHVKGVILFADLPGYSSLAKEFSPEECTFLPEFCIKKQCLKKVVAKSCGKLHFYWVQLQWSLFYPTIGGYPHGAPT